MSAAFLVAPSNGLITKFYLERHGLNHSTETGVPMNFDLTLAALDMISSYFDTKPYFSSKVFTKYLLSNSIKQHWQSFLKLYN